MKKSLDPRIVVLGVGGAGCNAVNNMIKFKKNTIHKVIKEACKNVVESDSNTRDLEESKASQMAYFDALSEDSDVSEKVNNDAKNSSDDLDYIEFAVCNTDIQALNGSPCKKKIQLGAKSAQGLGAGSKPESGKKSAEETLPTIMEFLEGANMVIITAGMGGGTGTGAAPVIAAAAKEAGILTLGIVTKPFMFEGSTRINTADKGIEELEKNVDTLIVVSNQNLHSITSGDTPFMDAFGIADKFLADCIRSVVNIIKTPGLINVDFADLCTVTKDRQNKAMMGSGIASGPNKGGKAAASAMSNLLLDFGDFSWKNVDHVLVCITGGNNLSMDDVTEATQKIHEEIASDAHIIVGATFKPEMEDHIQIFIFGTSKTQQNIPANQVHHKQSTNYDEFIGTAHTVNEDDVDFEYNANTNNKVSSTAKQKGFWSKLFGNKPSNHDSNVKIKKNTPDFFKNDEDQD